MYTLSLLVSGVLVFNTFFILWAIISFYFLKLLKKNIETKLFFDSYKESSLKTLEIYGNVPIKQIYILRYPVNSFLSFVLDLITWKKYSRQLNHYRDKSKNKSFYPLHVYIMVEVELKNKIRKRIIIEKVNGIEVNTNFRCKESQEMMKIKLKKRDKFTINKLLDKTRERIGDKQFYNWHFHKNNCQQFIIDILESIGKKKEIYNNFVSQEEFIKEISIQDVEMYVGNNMMNMFSFFETFIKGVLYDLIH